VVAWTQGNSIGGNTINHGMFLASDLAHVPFLLCCAAWLRGDLTRAGVYLGVSGLLHANYATLGPLVIMGAELVDCAVRLRTAGRRPSRRDAREQALRLLKLFGPFVVLAAPTLVMVARATLLSHADSQDVMRFLMRRAPHHYDLRNFVRQEYLTPLLALVLALPALGCLVPNRERVRYLVFVTLALVLIAWLGSSAGSSTIIQLRIWRIVVPLNTLCLVLASESIVRSWSDAGWGVRAWAAVGAVFFLLAQYDDAFVRSAGTLLTIAVPLLCASALAMRFSPQRERLAGGAAALCALAAVVWPGAKFQPEAALASAGNVTKALRLRGGPGRGERELYQRIRKELPTTASFLAPPSLFGFRLFARRAIFVDWKSTPMRGDEAIEWVRRIELTVGGPLRSRGFSQLREINKRYGERPTERYASIARREKLTHVITTRKLDEPERHGLSPLFSAGKYVVYAVGPAPAEPPAAPTSAHDDGR
jgi:hypothetical protein